MYMSANFQVISDPVVFQNALLSQNILRIKRQMPMTPLS